jgi:hypothetical protein
VEKIESSTPLSSSNNGDISLPREDKKSTASSSSQSSSIENLIENVEKIESSTPLSSSNNGDISLPREDKKSTASSSSQSSSIPKCPILNPTKNNNKDHIDLTVTDSSAEKYQKSNPEFSFQFDYDGESYNLNEKLSANSYIKKKMISDSVFRLCLKIDGVNRDDNVSSNFIKYYGYVLCYAHPLTVP